MKKVLILIAVIAILGNAIAFGGLALYNQGPATYRYEGIEIFAAHSDYQEFVSYTSREDVFISGSIKVYDLEPEVIVTYTVTVPTHIEWPYTYDHRTIHLRPHHYSAYLVWVLGSVLSMGVLIYISGRILWREKRKS